MAAIKAGTYKFNDTLTTPDSYLAEVINFICGTTNYIGITVLTGDKLTVAYGNSGGTATNVYENGWLSDEYQTITVLKDTVVNDANVAAWIEANTEYTSSAESIPPIIEVTYKGSTVMIEAGKTITLHTAGKKLTEDLVIKANEYEDKDSTPSLKGTAIPVGEPVERIYFNTNLTVEETNAYLSQLTYTQTDLSEYPLACPYLESYNSDTVIAIVIFKFGEETYDIQILRMNFNDSSLNDYLEIYHYSVGWYYERAVSINCSINGYLSAGESLAEFNGLPIGLENEKIKNVISITPFVAEGIVPVGELEITENGTFDVTEKAEVIVNVPSEEPVLTEKTVNANGTYTARDEGADGYSKVVVNVPIPEAPEVTSEEKTVTPTKSTQTVTPTNADYISKVTVEAIPDSYIQPSGSVTIVANGTYDVTDKASVTVNVESSGGETYEKYNGEVVIS